MKLTICLMALLYPFLSMCQPIIIKGKVINENGEPIAGATIIIPRTRQNTISDNTGAFSISYSPLVNDARPAAFDSLKISAVGYQSSALPLLGNRQAVLTIILDRKISELDEAIVIAYGRTTRRFSTGNIERINASEIQRQPVADPLATLAGRVPGLIVSQTNGMPGATIRLQLRGPSSLRQGSDPLFIIDGIPFAPNNDPINQMFSAAAPTASDGLSPFASIDPSSIESIEVLKDADATAIYGSRGANGVILITTKKAKAGKTRFSLNTWSSASHITNGMNWLNTQQYLKMRREAFANDGVTPTLTTAPDLLAWDTTRYTDFKKLILGNTAHTTSISAELSGGNQLTQFTTGATYLSETTVLPGDLSNKRASLRLSLQQQTLDKKFTMEISAAYSSGTNNLIGNTMLSGVRLPPNAPLLYDEDGKLNWQEGGASFNNPMAELLRSYEAKTANLTSSMQLIWKIMKDLSFRTSLGYNSLRLDETYKNPRTAANLLTSPNTQSSSSIGNSQFSNKLIEPQLDYSKILGRSKLNILVGSSWQETITKASKINATGFANDALILTPTAATTVTATASYTQYRYQAFFGRVNYNYQQRYILNASGRVDGSSRFGPGKRFAAFGAFGMAWILTNEKWLQDKISWLSFAKLRGSYGITGNDQIGNYQYLDTWLGVSAYQGSPALTPTRLFNPDYNWERNRKLEAGLDIGFLSDKILFRTAWFRNRSDNQLLNYSLPSQTGFSSIVRNFPALIQNTGWEFSLSVKTIERKRFVHSIAGNLTMHRNKLVSFPDLATSSYASSYVVGEPVNLIRNLYYTGVNPATGVYSFKDIDSNGTFNSRDYLITGHRNPPYYGGISNSIKWRNWQFDCFIEFRKQIGTNYLYSLSTIPGALGNQPFLVLARWQKPGDVAVVQQFTTTASTAAYRAVALLKSSNGVYSDASFIRGKTFSLSYSIPEACAKKFHAQSCRLYANAQNLFTISSFKGGDPESMNLNAIPLLKTVAIGFQLIF